MSRTETLLSRFAVVALPLLLVAGCNRPAAPATAGTLTDPATGATCTSRDNVRITQPDFSIVLHGACGDIVITASRGSLNVDKARSLRVEGDDVTVLNLELESAVVTGSRNTLNMGTVGRAEITGNDNILLGRKYGDTVLSGNGNTLNANEKPAIKDSGSGNRVM